MTSASTAAGTTAGLLPRSPPTTTPTSPLLHPTQASSLIDQCRTVRHLLQLHAAVLRAGLHYHPIVNFKLQRSYSSLGHLDHSFALFRLTPNPSVFFYSAAIHAHAAHGLHHTALLLLSDMLAAAITPNAFTLSAALKASPLTHGCALHAHSLKLHLSDNPYVATALLDMYARAGHATSARQVYDSLESKNLVTSTAMITCYAKMGDLPQAQSLFDEMPKRDHVCWNTMIDAYTQHGQPNIAVDMFRNMLASGETPDEVTVISVLTAVAQLGSLESGKWLHSYINTNSSSSFHLSAKLGTALIDMYCKCGSVEDACGIFDAIERKDVVAWNSMIVGYAMHGRSREALRLFTRMCEVGLRPTDITFIGVLNACSHAGLVSEGRALFASMKSDYGIDPKIQHYGCMVDLLGRTGLVEEAFDLVRGMRVEPDSALWGSLLAACRLHKRDALGERVADSMMDKGIANSGTYILLSNIYAASGNWREVGRVRAMMKESGIEKEPGCSSIEVDSKIYEFLVGDKTHPKSEAIYAMLEEMGGLLRACGYVPQTELVLHDLDETEKEKALEVHSEKLAIAFGLISTRPGTMIKIVKNLRVCADCHTVIKLVSKITGRKIVVRDRNRFHHFVGGSCSCGDFW